MVKAAATAAHGLSASDASATHAVDGTCSVGNSRGAEAVHQQHQEDNEDGMSCDHGHPAELAAQTSLKEALAARAREYEEQWRDARRGQRRLTLVQMNQVGASQGRLGPTTVNHTHGIRATSTGRPLALLLGCLACLGARSVCA